MADAPADLAEKPPEEKKSFLAKLGAAIPVALTAIATILAGMSTGALSQSMYWRSAAAQDQSKATNQWSLAGFKRDRSMMMQLEAATLASLSAHSKLPDFSAVKPPPPKEPKKGDAPKTPEEATAESKAAEEAYARGKEWLAGKGPPRVDPPKIEDSHLDDLLKAIREREPDAELLRKAGLVKHATIDKAVDDAEKFTEQTDRDWDPAVKAATAISDIPPKVPSDSVEYSAKAREATAAQAALFRMEQRRYRAESFLNQGIGYLYDARVKVSTAESDRHRKRSQSFFVAMLVAQIGAVIASLGMNKKKGSLSAIALLAGMVAIGFGAYVFLTM